MCACVRARAPTQSYWDGYACDEGYGTVAAKIIKFDLHTLFIFIYSEYIYCLQKSLSRTMGNTKKDVCSQMSGGQKPVQFIKGGGNERFQTHMKNSS